MTYSWMCAGLASILLLAGCPGNAERPSGTSRRVIVGTDAGGPNIEAIGCDGVFEDTLPIEVSDFSTLDIACDDTTVSAAPAFYRSCTQKSWSPDGCEIPLESPFCHHGYWTITCENDSQCPLGMRCTSGTDVGTLDLAGGGSYGWCAKTCTDAPTPECGRCDLECDPKLHVCRTVVKELDAP